MRWPGRRSLMTYLALRIVAPLSLAMLGLLFAGYLVYQQTTLALLLDHDSELAALAAFDVEYEIREYARSLQVAAGDHDLISPSIETRLAALRRAVEHQEQSYYDAMAVLDERGVLISSLPGEVAYDPAIAGLLQGAAPSSWASSDVLLGDIQLDPHTGEGRMVFGVPILREDGTFAGVLLGSFRTQDAELAELVGDLSPGTSGFAYLVDRRGHVIYHPDKSLIGVDFTDRPYVQSVGQGQTGGVVWDSPSGVRWFADYAPVGETGWGVVVKELWDIAVAPARVYGRAIIVAGLSTITVAIILLWLGVRHLAIPVELLVKQTEQIGEGKQNQPIGESGIREIDALGAALDQMAEQIEAYRSGLRRYAGAITRSQEEERRRIARELHDETVQNLFGIARRLELYQASTSDPQHLAHLEEIRRKVTETLEGVRQMSRDLRPRMLDDLGLVPALETLAHAALKGEGSVPRVAFEVAGAPSPAALSAEQELAVYRVAQEAMMNVRKHAQATRLQIRLAFEPQAVHLTIRDDGKGFNLPASLTNFIHQGHLGLMGMQERVWLVGGSLSVQSAPGQGTRLDLTVPIVDGRA